MMNEPHRITPHFNYRMPAFKRKHRCPIVPEIRLEELFRKVIFNADSFKLVFRSHHKFDNFVCAFAQAVLPVRWNAIAAIVNQATVRGIWIILIKPGILIEVRCSGNLQRRNRPIHVPQTFKVIFHFAPTANDIAVFRTIGSVKRTPRYGFFF